MTPQRSKAHMTPTSYIVHCSCRRHTLIKWAPSLRGGLGRYISLDTGWFPSNPEGWTCGREGHKQLIPPTPVPPSEHREAKHREALQLHKITL